MKHYFLFLACYQKIKDAFHESYQLLPSGFDFLVILSKVLYENSILVFRLLRLQQTATNQESSVCCK